MPSGEASPARADAADETIATLATRGIVNRPGRTLATATLAGLFAMGTSFAVTASPVVGMAALFAGILLVLGFRAGAMRFRLTGEGLHRSFVPFAGLGSRRTREQFFPFAAMRFYRRDRDWSRYRLDEVESLVIALRRPPFRVVIHDMIDKAAFATFADRFEALAEAADVPRQASFYGSLWARLLFALFALAAAGLLVLSALGTLNPTNTFRLLVVILPGVAYMGWRVLRRKAPPGAQGLQASEKGG